MRLIACCLLAVAACGDAGGGDPSPASDAAASLDSPSPSDAIGQSGLTVLWRAQPVLPGPFATNVMIRSVTLELARLEVIGDTGSTTETTTTNVDAIWSATAAPFPTTFSSAQPGLYSKVTLQIDGNLVAPSYEILGTVVIGGTTEQFRISDTAALPVDINGYNVVLTAGRSAEVPIHVDMQDAIDAVNFATLPIVNNTRTMNQTTPGIAAVRTALQTTTFR